MAHGLRELISENRQSAMTAAGLLLVVALGSLAYQLFLHKTSPVGTGYYTLDEGITWFPDNEDRITPFESESSPGLRVRLYRCQQHGEFAGYLERASDQGAQKARSLLEAARPNANTDAIRSEVAAILRNNALVKPLVKTLGSAAQPPAPWVAKISPEGERLVLSIKCPQAPDDPITPVDH